MRKKILFFSRLVVTLAILFALFKLVPYGQLIEVYKDSKKNYLFLAALIFLSSLFVGGARWRFLLASLGVKVTFKEVMYCMFCGMFFNLFFPSFVAGDVFRGLSISSRHGDLKKTASSVLMDRFNGGVALTLVAIVSFALGPSILRQKQVVIPLLILCFAACFGFLLIFSKRFFLRLTRVFKKNSSMYNKLISFHDQLYFFRKNPKVFFQASLFSFPMQISTPLAFFITAKAFGLEVDLIYFLILIPIILAIALIPVTIAGIGTREVSAVYFFSLIGVEKSVGLGISLLNLVFMVFTGIVGGIIYVSVYHRWLQRNPQNTSA